MVEEEDWCGKQTKRNWESEDYDGQKTENRESMKIEGYKKWEKNTEYEVEI